MYLETDLRFSSQQCESTMLLHYTLNINAGPNLNRQPEAEVKSVEAQCQNERPPVVAVGKVGYTPHSPQYKIHLCWGLVAHTQLLHLSAAEHGLGAPKPQEQRFAAADVDHKNATLSRVLQDPDAEEAPVWYCHWCGRLNLSKLEQLNWMIKRPAACFTFLISKSKNTFIIKHHRLQLVKQSMTAERNPSTPLVHFQVLVFVSSSVAPQHLFLSALLYFSDLSRLNCSDLILHKRRADPKSSDVVFCIPHFAWRSVIKCFIKCNLAELPWRVCIAVQFYFRQCGCCIEIFPPLRRSHFFHVPATKLWTGWKYVIYGFLKIVQIKIWRL